MSFIDPHEEWAKQLGMVPLSKVEEIKKAYQNRLATRDAEIDQLKAANSTMSNRLIDCAARNEDRMRAISSLNDIISELRNKLARSNVQ